MARECVNADLREHPQALHGIGQPPLLKQCRVRVDAHAQPAVFTAGGDEALTESQRIHYSETLLCSSSCRLVTVISLPRSASIPCTAAVTPCTVVMIGTLETTAAARMS